MEEVADEMEVADFSAERGAAPLSVRLVCMLVKKYNDLARRKDGTLNRKLADLVEYKVPASKVPRHGVYSKDVVIDPKTGVWVRIFLPSSSSRRVKKEDTGNGALAQKEKLPVIFYFHGGGFALLCANFIGYDIFCRRLCRRCQAAVISVNYRRAPEHPYPVPYDDSYAAVEWLKGELRRGGEAFLPHALDASRCFLMGDSAGANIVHHVGVKLAEEAPAAEPMRITAHVLLFPFFGGEERTPAELRLEGAPLVSVENADWYWRAFLPRGADRDHPACNVVGPRAPSLAGVRGLPPSLVVIAEFDVLKDWQMRYARGLRQAGQRVRLLYYKKAIHAFHILNSLKLSSRLLADLQAFIADGF